MGRMVDENGTITDTCYTDWPITMTQSKLEALLAEQKILKDTLKNSESICEELLTTQLRLEKKLDRAIKGLTTIAESNGNSIKEGKTLHSLAHYAEVTIQKIRRIK